MNGWEVADDGGKQATKAQRRLVHIGADEVATKPELAKLLTRDEAAQLIAVFLALRERYKKSDDMVQTTPAEIRNI